MVLGFNQHAPEIKHYWLADHAHVSATTAAVPVMDLYERNYQLGDGAVAARLNDAFFHNFQWDRGCADRALPKAQ
ncbi:hypothetical protein [Caballeronia mineralivorans]|uniref:hypothetical protein n=1 Tax=Caballeronia mineralivorans TaxID=2010198 RepID=UPI00069ED6AA|nr:hypothetical protein [Caballeronia mineralivorans]